MSRPSDDASTVGHWLDGLRDGSPDAAQRLWGRYVGKLSALIRRRLQRHGVRRVDEEDVVVDVFASLCRGAERGRFPRLRDEEDLWQVLLMLTNNKVVDQVRKSPLPHTQSALGVPADQQAGRDPLAMVVGGEPTPEFAAEVADELEYRLAQLSASNLERLGINKLGGHRSDELSAMLRTLAARELEGRTQQEIATELGLSLRVVQRGARVVRMIWGVGG